MLQTFLLALTLTVQDLPRLLPDHASFIAEVRKRMRTDTQLLGQYTYTLKRTSTRVDSSGKPTKTEVDVFEVFPGSADRVEYERQTIKKGVPLSAKDLDKQDRDYEKRNRISPEKRRKRQADEEREENEFIEDLFGVFETSLIGRENVGGRSTIVVDFRPRARSSYKTKSDDGKHLRKFKGRVWFDEIDYEGVRLEVEAIEPVNIGLGLLAKLQKGARITNERKKFNDEVWLPVRVEVSIDLRLMLLKGLRIRQVLEFSDHRKYSVDTILKFPDDPEQRP
jgi:hypothetical protein